MYGEFRFGMLRFSQGMRKEEKGLSELDLFFSKNSKKRGRIDPAWNVPPSTGEVEFHLFRRMMSLPYSKLVLAGYPEDDNKEKD